MCRLAEINVIFNLSRCPILKCEIASENVRCDSYYKCVEIHLPLSFSPPPSTFTPPLLLSLLPSLFLTRSLDSAKEALFIYFTITAAVHPHTSLEPSDSVMTHSVRCLPGLKCCEEFSLPSHSRSSHTQELHLISLKKKSPFLIFLILLLCHICLKARSWQTVRIRG